MIHSRRGDAHPMSRLLFVVHRYAPYPGGSEYNVQRLAEEAMRRGHRATVLADTHLGDYLDRYGFRDGPVPPKPAGQRATPGEWALP
jgi:hypothetical protein